MNGTFSFYECRFSAMDINSWWGHLNPPAVIKFIWTFCTQRWWGFKMIFLTPCRAKKSHLVKLSLLSFLFCQFFKSFWAPRCHLTTKSQSLQSDFHGLEDDPDGSRSQTLTLYYLPHQPSSVWTHSRWLYRLNTDLRLTLKKHLLHVKPICNVIQCKPARTDTSPLWTVLEHLLIHLFDEEVYFQCKNTEHTSWNVDLCIKTYLHLRLSICVYNSIFQNNPEQTVRWRDYQFSILQVWELGPRLSVMNEINVLALGFV